MKHTLRSVDKIDNELVVKMTSNSHGNKNKNLMAINSDTEDSFVSIHDEETKAEKSLLT